MNLEKLFEAQRRLDKRIIPKHSQNESVLNKKILALQVELGELANELPEVFKYWSNKKNNLDNALKELVDCIHFVLSIGIEMDYELDKVTKMFSETLTEQFNALFWITAKYEEEKYESDYEILFGYLLGLGEMLGFTWEEIEAAYYEKNAENFRRQEVGY